ncbi:hypothetical protein OROMI_024349 [Orobanche minor]
MKICAPISTCSKNVVRLTGNIQSKTIIRASNAFKQSSCCYYTYTPGKHPSLHNTTTLKSQANSCSPLNGGYQVFQEHLLGFGTAKHVPNCHSLTFSSGFKNVDSRLREPKLSETFEIKCNVGPFSSTRRISLSAGVFAGFLVCFYSSGPYYAEAYEGNEKKVVTDYSVIGIPGDGRCLFRSVVHGVCMRSGKPAPSESLQRELADELRARVADEFTKRRNETEWFIEGDFETYVSRMRKPHVWGGEPELWMASHVLRMPITVYMHDPDSGGLISIAEYGQEYGKENPIEVLYYGYGHYDALQNAGYLSNSGKARSQIGYVFTYGDTAISWRYVKQSLSATPSNHAEILSIHEAI